MEIYSKRKNGIIILYLSGDLNIDSSDLIEVVGWHVRNGRLEILCDFTNVNLIDYSGISALTIAYKNVQNHKGNMKLCELPIHIRKLINAVCLDKVFEIYDSQEEAIRSFQEDTTIDEIKRRPLRRRFERLAMDIPVEFKSKYSRDDEFHMGKIFNVSGVGAFIFAEKTYPAGDDLILHISLLPKPGMIEAEGKVLWLSDKQTQPQLYPGMGVGFLDISPEQQKKILRFIERNAPLRKST